MASLIIANTASAPTDPQVIAPPPVNYTFDELTDGSSTIISGSQETRSVRRRGVITALNNDVLNTDAMIDEIISTIVPESGTATLVLPGRHPTVPFLYVKDFKIDSTISNKQTGQEINGIAVYSKYMMEILYETLPYDTLTGIEVTSTFGYEQYPIAWPNSTYWLNTADNTDNFPIGLRQVSSEIQIPINEYSIRFHRVPRATYDSITTKIRQKQGKVNDALLFGAEPGTLKFDGATTSYTIGPDGGARVYTLDYRFSERTIFDEALNETYGWNHELREARILPVSGTNVYAPQWELVSLRKDSYKPRYEETDLGDLFSYVP